MTTALSCEKLKARPRPDLTPRETQIARLVAGGLSNDQIARRLQISRWTVTNHLRRIMLKWSCASRVDVAVHLTVSERSTS